MSQVLVTSQLKSKAAMPVPVVHREIVAALRDRLRGTLAIAGRYILLMILLQFDTITITTTTATAHIVDDAYSGCATSSAELYTVWQLRWLVAATDVHHVYDCCVTARTVLCYNV
jgi:hypothetical protein